MSVNVKSYNPVRESNIFRFLDTNGDGTGITNAIGNYNVTPTEFFIKPLVGEVYEIDRLIIQIADNGSIDAGSYGNGISLTNGIIIQKIDDLGNILIDLTNNAPILTNGDWAKFNYDLNSTSFGSGLNYVNIRWSFNKVGDGVILNDNERLAITLNDRFTALNGHYFQVQGNTL